MSEDKFLRIVLGTIIFGLISVFWPQIMKFLKKIGYTRWR